MSAPLKFGLNAASTRPVVRLYDASPSRVYVVVLPVRWFWIEVNVPATKTRLPTTSRSQISPLLIFGMSARGVRGTRVLWFGSGFGSTGGVTVPGLTTTENFWVFATALLDRATRAAAVPVATGPLESATSELILLVLVVAGA